MPSGEQTITDSRSDEEIVASLQQFQPINADSEKNIWAFWDGGLATCKPWMIRNIVSWIRRHGSAWTVRVLNIVDGSPNHWSKYLPPSSDIFPEAFLRQTMSGTHRAVHASDLLRLPLLYRYGGVYLDVGFMLFRSLDDLCWKQLGDDGTPYELAGFKMTISDEIAMFWNGFIAARKGCEAVKHWYETFLKLWEGKNGMVGANESPLLRHLPRYEVPSSTGDEPAFAYSEYVDYLAHMFCVERIRHLKDPLTGWNGPAFFADRVSLYECVTEVYWAQALTHWNGRKQYELLSQQKDESSGSELHREAKEFVDGILSTSSTMKLSRGIVTDQREYLARIWSEEDPSADQRPGTFAEHLRWASVHYEQTSKLKPLLLPVRGDALLTGAQLTAVGRPHRHWDDKSS